MCDECGLPGTQCEDRFNVCLAKEFEDAQYGKVHNLTVSTYMLQHSSRLTREGWLYERELLREFLTKKTPEEIRMERKELLDSGKRTFKIRSKTGLPVIPRTTWAKTVLDIRLDNAAKYCEDVRAWAAATLADSERLNI